MREDGPPVWFPLSCIDSQAFGMEAEAGRGSRVAETEGKETVSKGGDVKAKVVREEKIKPSKTFLRPN